MAKNSKNKSKKVGNDNKDEKQVDNAAATEPTAATRDSTDARVDKIESSEQGTEDTTMSDNQGEEQQDQEESTTNSTEQKGQEADDNDEEEDANEDESKHDDARENDAHTNDKDAADDDDAEEEADAAWDLKKVMTIAQVNGDLPILCQTEGCQLLAAVLYVSTGSPPEKWYGCLDCQVRIRMQQIQSATYLFLLKILIPCFRIRNLNLADGPKRSRKFPCNS